MVSVSSTIAKEAEFQEKTLMHKFPKVNVSDLVKSASRVIAPLWPISTFASRNPWMGLEEQSFEQVARWLRATHHVDIYPSITIVNSAKKRGEIDESFLEMGLQQWLSSQSIKVPHEKAEQFCRAALKMDKIPSSILDSPEIQNLAETLEKVELANIKNQSVQPLSRRLEDENKAPISSKLDYHLIKWCKLFLDESQAAWRLPNREKGFYHAWRNLIERDPTLTRNQRKQFKDWPQEANAALEKALSSLNIPQSRIQDYLEAHLLALPGWAGMMLWRSQHYPHERTLVTEYLAVRLSMEWILIKPYLPIRIKQYEKQEQVVPLLAAWVHWGGMTTESWSDLSSADQKEYLTLAYRFDEMTCRKLWLEAWEETYADQLSKQLNDNNSSKNATEKTLAQFLFCIDVRSEPFRRQLEKIGPYETYGIAGFFGLPIEVSELGSDHTHASLPVILKPKHKVKETTVESELKQYQERRDVVHSLNYSFKKMKQNLFASLLLPEMSGPWLSLQMLGRTFFPHKAGRSFRHLHESWLSKPSTEFSFVDEESREAEFDSVEEKVQYVRQALKMIGLTKNFAPLVIICGHGSHSTNNPYASALDCGACGGGSGKFNASVLATLCNQSEIREALEKEGILIPKNTVFVAAEHITTLDELRWVYVPKLTDEALEVFERLQNELPKVSHDANEERLSRLPNVRFNNPKTEAQRIAEDWSEVRPEWGLARNASFIIGRRELTKECDLEGRAFLHDYDWQTDPDGTMLSNIIAGPGTVTQWINLQYYASTVAPHFYGSGSKATQTVIAGLGVMQGNASDLLSGLPWQSVMKSDEEAYHSPLRLLVVIEAPRKYVQQLLDNNTGFRQKVQNGWIRLASIDQDGDWESWS